MLKAYIIKSRVRVAENLLIVQPYSPHLFRQGVNPGPQLLLNVLTKKMSEKEAKAEWKRLAKNKEDAATTGESWLLSQTIPCRRCSDRDRDSNEVWKPLSSFTSDMFPDELWTHVVCKGQDAICFTCRNELGDENTLRHMCCDECGTIKPKDKFSDEQRERWEALDGHAVLCMSCEGTSSRRSLAELVACNGELCLGRHIPTYNFDQNLFTYWRSKQLSADVHCARCYIRSDTCNRKTAGSTK